MKHYTSVDSAVKILKCGFRNIPQNAEDRVAKFFPIEKSHGGQPSSTECILYFEWRGSEEHTDIDSILSKNKKVEEMEGNIAYFQIFDGFYPRRYWRIAIAQCDKDLLIFKGYEFCGDDVRVPSEIEMSWLWNISKNLTNFRLKLLFQKHIGKFVLIHDERYNKENQ